MSSKRAMKQAQKQAYAKHRSNITNSRFEKKNRNSINLSPEDSANSITSIILNGIKLEN